MRSAGNFHPEWGYLAPAPSFMRTVRIALVATAIGATAGAAVVVTLVGRPSSHANSSSIAAHTLVTSVQPMAVQPAAPAPGAAIAATPAVSTPAPAVQAASIQPPPLAAPPAQAPIKSDAAPAVVARMPATIPPASAVPSQADPTSSVPAPQPASVAALTDPPPPAIAEPTPVREEVTPGPAPAKKTVRRRHGVNYDARRWQQPTNEEAKRHWQDDGGFAPLLRLFSFRAGNSYSPN